MIQDFKAFLLKGNVMDLAVGFMFGAGDLFIALDGNTYASLAALEEAGAPAIKYGTFINDAIGFILLGFVIFMLVRSVSKMQKKEEAKPAAPAADIVLLTEIRDALKK